MSDVLAGNDVSIGFKRSGYPKICIAEQLNFKAQQGALISLLGPNGRGKSTLLRTISGLQPSLKGEICIKDKSIHKYSLKERARMVSIVLTEKVDIGHATVSEIVALGRSPYTGWLGMKTDEDTKIIKDALHTFHLHDLADRYYDEISDGECQRALIARAFVQQPEVIILDEPTSYLDAGYQLEIMSLLQKTVQENNITVILSTHDVEAALRFSDYLWLFQDKTNLFQGTPEDLVLNGSLEKLYPSDSIFFDKEHGQYNIRKEKLSNISIMGEGVYAYWTKRAIDRGIDNSKQDVEIRVNEDREPHWEIILVDKKKVAVSIAEVLEIIKNN